MLLERVLTLQVAGRAVQIEADAIYPLAISIKRTFLFKKHPTVEPWIGLFVYGPVNRKLQERRGTR